MDKDVRVGVDVSKDGLYFVVMDMSNNVLYAGNNPDQVRKYKVKQLIVDEQDLSSLISNNIVGNPNPRAKK